MDMEEKTTNKKRKINKSRLIIKIVAAILAITFVASMLATAIFYFI